MARSQETYNKKEIRTKKEKKRKEKEQKKQERRAQPKGNLSFDDMIAYVDENGRITSTPPESRIKTGIKIEDIEISVPRRQQEAVDRNIRHGVLTFFNKSKGFGFIRDLDNQRSVFVHENDMESIVNENSRVTFEIEKGVRGSKAVRVKPAQQ